MKASPTLHGIPHRSPLSRKRNAFTLIELLVVIAIIAILVGMGAYVYPKAIDMAKKTRTKALIADVANAVKSYKLEYNRLPVDSGADDATTIEFDSGDGETILRILMGENLALGSRTAANPREIVFIEPDTSTGVSLGVVMDGDTPTKLLDSWGQVIKIRMDADYGKTIPNPDESSDTTKIRKEVIVWSDGSPSGEFEGNDWANNVTNWN